MKISISINISLKCNPKGPINNIPASALVYIMAWRCPGDKPLSEPTTFSLPTHLCVTRLQWVKDYFWSFVLSSKYMYLQPWQNWFPCYADVLHDGILIYHCFGTLISWEFQYMLHVAPIMETTPNSFVLNLSVKTAPILVKLTGNDAFLRTGQRTFRISSVNYLVTHWDLRKWNSKYRNHFLVRKMCTLSRIEIWCVRYFLSQKWPNPGGEYPRSDID